MQHNVDNDGRCLLLFAGNMLLNIVAAVGIMTFLQGLAMLASIVASIYVAIDHHKKIKWKKRQDRSANDHDKQNDNGNK